MELRTIFQSHEPNYISKNYILWARPVGMEVYFYKYTDGKWRPIGESPSVTASIKDIYSQISSVKSSIPTKVSQLDNDSLYITRSVMQLDNYYTKTETDKMVSDCSGVSVMIVGSLPSQGNEKILYFTPTSHASLGNIYDEYMWINGKWEEIGSSYTDLSNYYNKSQIDTALSDLNTSLTGRINTVSGSLDSLKSSYDTFTGTTFPTTINGINSSISNLSSNLTNNYTPTSGLESFINSKYSSIITWCNSVKPYIIYDSSIPGIKISTNLTVTGEISSGNYKLSDLSKYALISNIDGYISDYIAAHPSSGSGGTVDLSNYYSKTDLASYIAWLDRVMPKFDYITTDSALKALCDLYSTGGVSAYGNSSTSSGGGTSGSGGLIQTVYAYSNIGGAYSDSIVTDTFNAYTIAKLANRISTLESGSAVASNYYSKTEIDTKLSDYALKTSVPTTEQITSWNNMASNVHTHSNKTQLDAITADDISWIHTMIQYLSYDSTNTAVRSSIGFISEKGVTAYG